MGKKFENLLGKIISHAIPLFIGGSILFGIEYLYWSPRGKLEKPEIELLSKREYTGQRGEQVFDCIFRDEYGISRQIDVQYDTGLTLRVVDRENDGSPEGIHIFTKGMNRENIARDYLSEPHNID